ncbi:MAG: translation initiation factor IF-2 [Proteobacteria bacterium]|nr:translation initiation factor IF-2 [Pseudomonadota bacterium]MCP4916066.1 translation initiation factor IF-2 [Pseudomonadota bacterium]
MASKKDLLDRMQSTRVTTRRRPAAETTAETGTEPKRETRVGSGRQTVIRRRRKADGGGTQRVVTVRRPAATPEPVVETPTPTPDLSRLTAEAEAAPTPEPVVEAKAEPVVEAAPVKEPVVEAKAEPVAEAKAEAKPEPVVEAKPEPVVEAKPEPVVEAKPEPVVEAKPEPPPPPAPPKMAATTPSGRPRLPGLGAAVVRPPPGYDPNNPEAYKAKAKADAERSAGRVGGGNRGGSSSPAASGSGTTGARPGSAAPKRWDDKKKGSGRPSPNDRKRRGGRRMQRLDNLPTRALRGKRKKKGVPKLASPKPSAQKRKVMVDGTISVKQLAMEMGVKAGQVIKFLMSLDVMVTMNDQLDFDTAQLVGQEFEYEAINVGFQEEEHLIQDTEEVDENAVERPPVITIMGHVDHGKTTLLDTIRKAKVADAEAGGITQHIGAYQVRQSGQTLTFIDTPGHEAFTEMRARGAQATDIVILVVAADDGVMPQTVESINHAKAAGVPILVAVNKCDKPGVDPGKIRQELMQYELVSEEYGGETMMVNVSALEGTGVDELLEGLLLTAEILELKANPDRHAEGVVLEARVEQGRGAVATILVQTGTLKLKDPLVLGVESGKVRAMNDHKGKRIKTAGPSTPVEIIGLAGVPAAGDIFSVVASDKDAKRLAEHRLQLRKDAAQSKNKKLTLAELLSRQKEGEAKKLNVIIRADVQGSIEAIKAAVNDINVDGATVNVLHAAVGKVSESDITLAGTYEGIVIGFNARPDAKARRAAEEKAVEVRHYRVIYQLLEDLENALSGLLEPVYEEKIHGHAEVRALFVIPKVGTICGSYVTNGTIARGHNVRLLRDGIVVYDGKLKSLRRFKDDVKEVTNGYECGVGLENFNDVKVGDEYETYTVVEVQRS